MNRQLNTKLLLRTIGGLIAVLVVVHIVHRIQVSRNARVLLQRADQAIAGANYVQGADYLRRYLAYEPDDAAARMKYALALDKLAATNETARRKAMLEMDQILRRDPKNKHIRNRAVHHAIQAQRYTDAVKHLEYLLQDAKTPSDLRHKIGWCHEANGDYESAAEALQAAVRADPHKIETYLLLMEIYRDRLHQIDDAARVLDDLVKANPKSYRAYLERGRFQQSVAKFEDAEKDIRQALQLAPKQVDVLLAATNLANAQRKTKLARKYLQDGMSANPKNAALYAEMATLEVRDGRRQQAIQWLQDGLAKIPDSQLLQFQLADLFLDDRQRIDAEKLLGSLKQSKAPRRKIEYLQARLLMDEKEWRKAAELLQTIDVDSKKNKAFAAKVHALLGWCYGRLGNRERELKAFQDAAALQPSWATARFGLGQAYLANGQVAEALEQFRPLQKSPTIPNEFWKVFGKALVMQNSRAVHPRWLEAEHALRKAAQVDPRDAEIAVWQAEMFALQQRFADADQLLQNTLALQRKDVSLWTASAILAARQHDFQRAFATIAEAEKLLGDQVDLRLAKGRLHLARGGTNAAKELGVLAQGANRFSESDQTRLWNGLAHQFYQLGEWRRAKTLWERLAHHDKNDLSSRLFLFELALRARSKDAANWLKDIQRIDGEHGVWRRYGEALLLLQNGSPLSMKRASRLVDEIAMQRPKWSKLFLLKGQIADRNGDGEQVIGNYRKALQLGELRSDMVYRLAHLLSQRRRFFDADRVIALAERLGPLEKQLARLGAEVALENRDVNRALHLAKQSVSEDSRDYRDLIWLAAVQTKAGKSGEAEAVFRRLLTHSARIPDVWTAWVRHLVGRDLRDRAEVVIEEMKKKLPADRLPLALARCYELTGQTGRAEKVLLQLVKTRSNDFVVLSQLANFYRRMDEPTKAEPYLRKMLDPSLGVPGPLLVHIRRRLALIWAAQGKIDQALTLVDANRGPRSKNVSDERARWAILAHRESERAAAIERFEKSVADGSASNEEQLWLAEMLERSGRLEEAQKRIVGLLADDGNDPQLLAWQIRLLLKQHNISDARTFLDRLAKREPDSIRLHDLRKQLKIEMKKIEDISG